MPKVIQTGNLTFEKRAARVPEFDWLTCMPRLGDLAKSKHLKFDIRSLDPGKFSFPYHFHRAAEELFFIISGEATLRSPQGFQKVSKGDLIFFEEGPEGAHQVYNDSDAPCVYLDICTLPRIDVGEYPDSGKIIIMPEREMFRASSKVDYYDGEENVKEKWPTDILRK